MTKTNINPTTLIVSIKSPTKNIFDGEVKSVTSVNERGVFDILPLHTNFITLIKEYVKIDKGLPTEKKFVIEKGVLYVISNKINIYQGI